MSAPPPSPADSSPPPPRARRRSSLGPWARALATLALAMVSAAFVLGAMFVLALPRTTSRTVVPTTSAPFSTIYRVSPGDREAPVPVVLGSLLLLAGAWYIWRTPWDRPSQPPAPAPRLPYLALGVCVALVAIAVAHALTCRRTLPLVGGDRARLTTALCLLLGAIGCVVWIPSLARAENRRAALLPRMPIRVRCPTCDYDFRGLTALRCPECGSTFTIEQLLAAQGRSVV